MRQSDSARNPVALRSLILLAVPFAAVGAAWLLLVPSAPEQLADPVADAVIALESGDIETAFQIVNKLHSDSADAKVTYLLAVTEGLRGNNERALEVIQELPEFQTDPRLLTMGGQFALAVPRLAVARRLLDQAIELDPDHEEAVRLLVSLEGNLLNVPKVRTLIATLDQLDKATAEDVFLFCSGSRVSYDLYENVDRLEAAYRNEPDQGEIAYALINNYLAMNRLDEAEKVIIAAHGGPLSKSWLIHLAEAELAVISDDFEQAADSLLKVGTSGEMTANYWIVLGRVLRKQGVSMAAIDAYRNAAQLAPFDPDPVFALSRLVAESSPQDAELMKKKTRLLQQLSVQVEAVVTLDSFEEAVERFPLIVEKLVDAGAYREAKVCLNWLKSEGYRSRAATVQDGRLRQLTSFPPLELVPPSTSGLLVVDTSSLAGREGTASAEDLISFRDVTDELNVDFEYVSPSDANTTILTSLGGGVAGFDFDNDGATDLFLPQAGCLPGTEDRSSDRDCLLRRTQNAYVDVSSVSIPAVSDYGHGVSVGDTNGDGFPDLLVTNFGRNQLLLNNGDGTFTDAAVASRLSDSEWSVSSALEDFDDDGDIDVYVVNYLTIDVQEMEKCTDERSTPCGPLNVPGCQDRLYENLSDGTFRDVTQTSGIVVPDGKGLGVVVRDFDGDGRRDIFVGNDTTQNRLFFNESTDQQLNFREASAMAGVAVGGDGKSEACMGITSADLDGNGFPEIFVTNFEGETNTLYTNLGNRTFVDNTEAMELGRSSYTLMGWGTQFLDIDDDSMLDLVVLNGHLHNDSMRPQIYLQKNARFNFPSSYHGDYFNEEWLGRALAVADINSDASPDLIVTHRTGRPRVLLNQSGTQRRFAIRLIATNSHRDAQGAKVIVESADSEVARVLNSDGGYLSANERALWFVIPESGVIDTLTIEWPSGRRHLIHDLTPYTNTFIVETDTQNARVLTLPR